MARVAATFACTFHIFSAVATATTSSINVHLQFVIESRVSMQHMPQICCNNSRKATKNCNAIRLLITHDSSSSQRRVGHLLVPAPMLPRRRRSFCCLQLSVAAFQGQPGWQAGGILHCLLPIMIELLALFCPYAVETSFSCVFCSPCLAGGIFCHFFELNTFQKCR